MGTSFELILEGLTPRPASAEKARMSREGACNRQLRVSADARS